MAACENCWAAASRRVLLLGGFTADHYREILADGGCETEERQREKQAKAILQTLSASGHSEG